MPLFRWRSVSMQGAKETAELLAAHDESTAKKEVSSGPSVCENEKFSLAL
jgi:hypothetical protein